MDSQGGPDVGRAAGRCATRRSPPWSGRTGTAGSPSTRTRPLTAARHSQMSVSAMPRYHWFPAAPGGDQVAVLEGEARPGVREGVGQVPDAVLRHVPQPVQLNVDGILPLGIPAGGQGEPGEGDLAVGRGDPRDDERPGAIQVALAKPGAVGDRGVAEGLPERLDVLAVLGRAAVPGFDDLDDRVEVKPKERVAGLVGRAPGGCFEGSRGGRAAPPAWARRGALRRSRRGPGQTSPKTTPRTR